jgi:integrase
MKVSKQWYVKGNHNNKKIFEPCGPLKQAATLRIGELNKAISEGGLLTKEAVKTWEDGIAALQADEKKQATQDYYRKRLVTLGAEFAGNNLIDVTPERLAAFDAKRKAAGISESTRRGEILTVQLMFKQVTKHLKARDYPRLHEAAIDITKVGKPTIDNYKDDFWSKEEIALLTSKCPMPLALTVRIQSETGLRPGNVYRLRYSYFDGRQITIPGEEMKAGKTFITSISIALYRDLTAYMMANGVRDWLFPTKSRTGEVIPVDGYRKPWVAALKASGLSGTPHKLRHSFASIQLGNGVPLIEVSRLLGHADIAITARRYGHLERKQLDNRLDEHHAFMAAK